MDKTICIGFDSTHPDAFAVARFSLRRRMRHEIPIIGIELGAMQQQGIYKRPVERRILSDGASVLFDPISQHAMSTEFAISRFITPFLAHWRGWALFMDCDVLAFTDICRLFELLDNRFALMCVQPDYAPRLGRKMDGQIQSSYARKLWSSVMAFNCDHAANSALTLDMINTLPGRDLHRFCWLPDSLIGALPPEWNWIAGVTDPQISPALVHYTEGGPWLPGFENVEFAEQWRAERSLWVAGDGVAI
jgi:hypothetical protein